MCLANIDNDQNGYTKIITGSLQGILRIYLPREREYKAEDLLLEHELEQAILQLAAGRFSAVGGVQLAVLHPRKIAVYALQSVGNSFLQHQKLFEHYLEHTAANFVCGGFGGVPGCDYICVQSYDGQLSFIEQEAPAFTRFLPNFLVPGPLCYCEASDSFITCNAAFEIESYKYKVIAAATSEKTSSKDGVATVNASLHAAKRLQADWKVILGEAAIDIRAGKYSPNTQAFQADIVVLCEHNLFILNVSGQLTFQKRLDYHPACCSLHPAPKAKSQGGADNLLVCTFSKTLHVYRGNVLCWVAKMDLQAVAVGVAEFGGTKGMIAALADNGELVVAYLGTDPLLNPVGFNEGKELDYEAMDREQRRLAAIIRDSNSDVRVEPPDRLTMKAKIPLFFDSRSGDELSAASRAFQNKTVTVRLYLSWSAPGLLTEVLISIRPPPPVTVEETTLIIPEIVGSSDEPAIVDVSFTASNTCLPSSNVATVVASYVNDAGEPRCSVLEVALPMCLFCTVIPPVKSAEYKITLTANRAPPQLVHIFDDMVSQAVGPAAAALSASAAQGSNVLSFQYFSGADATILVSKTGGRYRIQSDTFEAMWLVAQELCRRLVLYYAQAEASMSAAEGPFTITYDEPVPMEDFFEVIDAHFAARLAVSELAQQLEARAHQFRSIEKRLLMRFKDKNPAPLSQLDLLMEDTYHQLMDLGAAQEERQQALATISNKLAAAVQLMLIIIKYRFGLDRDAELMLRCCLSPEVLDSAGGVGWEEHTEAAVTGLLRTVLARNAKEAAAAVIPLASFKDTARLKKHLSLVLERMAKGMKLSSGERSDALHSSTERLYRRSTGTGMAADCPPAVIEDSIPTSFD